MPFVNEPKSPFADGRPHMVITANIHLKKQNGYAARGECGEVRRRGKNDSKTEKWAQPTHRLLSVFLV